MELTVNLITTSKEIKNIFKIVKERNFDDFTPLSKMREEINFNLKDNISSLSERERIKYVNILKDYDFFAKENYELPEGEDKTDLYDLMNTLTRFRNQILIFIDLIYNENRESYQLERLVSPPLEAYEYVGHNKTNIEPSTRSFGLLFE